MDAVDSTNFSGPGAIFALVLAHVRVDLWSLQDTTEAYKTAEKFLTGGTCEHVECRDCGEGLEGECWNPTYAGPYVCLGCNHPLGSHWVATYDWAEHRDLIINALGLDVEGIVGLIRSGR